MNNFEQATRTCLRFQTNLGTLSVEDLWNISLEELDQMAVFYKKELDGVESETFLKKEKVEDESIRLSFEICKHIIETRVEENEVAAKARANKAKNQRIMELIADKENDELKESSIEELRAMLKESE